MIAVHLIVLVQPSSNISRVKETTSNHISSSLDHESVNLRIISVNDITTTVLMLN